MCPHFCGMELTINAQTKISQLLEVDRDLVIKTLVSLNKKFSKLKKTVLRNLLIKRVSIADACKISKTEIADFMSSMTEIGFKVAGDCVADTESTNASVPFLEPLNYLELDIRPILAQDKDPLKEILSSVKALKKDQGLKLINTFEPTPLVHLLAGKGFTHRVEYADMDTVITYFNKSGVIETDIPVREPAIDDQQFDMVPASFVPEQISYLDVRELEMPKPMLAILEQTRNLTAGHALFVHHKKIPVYLLPELEKHGLQYVFKTIAPGNINMLIYKK